MSEIKVNATKSLIGHCLGASAGLEGVGPPRHHDNYKDDPPNYDDRYNYNEHRDKGYRNYRNHDRYERRDNVLKIKIDAPKFDGRFDPIAFSDWLSSMDKFFDWHMMSEYRMVRFARIKLVKQANVFLKSLTCLKLLKPWYKRLEVRTCCIQLVPRRVVRELELT
ncbi:hypothetical protein POM88_037572 [Heracleum sosnowskyi]|uniref:Uncharacterized protein n=1 Tax=Heracleum sosnowskyi TaxID=360622 RepID=A0AAD8HQG9_9APIA|nr:hypothetical protein POM88_037572 [Heracleum sosnowskyi]